GWCSKAVWKRPGMTPNPGSDSALVRRIHIDTDPGLDDLLALALKLASPEVKLEAITTMA
ncbi:MAG: hypothetical protein O7B29_10525, partial [Deltaproteobacteria bacterium]|nr:hypothetical protein [Deltaproteobacteria bacterium]